MAFYYGEDDDLGARFEADQLQASYEEQGRAHSRRALKVRNHLAAAISAAPHLAAKLRQKAATLCPHGWGYPLDSTAATDEKDPHQGGEGWRCKECGSRLTGPGADVVTPCEIAPTAS